MNAQLKAEELLATLEVSIRLGDTAGAADASWSLQRYGYRPGTADECKRLREGLARRRVRARR